MSTARRNPFQLRVNARMKQLGLRQQDVVMRGGLSQSALSFVQNGRTKSLNMERIFRLADALECDARWLALGEGTPDKK